MVIQHRTQSPADMVSLFIIGFNANRAHIQRRAGFQIPLMNKLENVAGGETPQRQRTTTKRKSFGKQEIIKPYTVGWHTCVSSAKAPTTHQQSALPSGIGGIKHSLISLGYSLDRHSAPPLII